MLYDQIISENNPYWICRKNNKKRKEREGKKEKREEKGKIGR